MRVTEDVEAGRIDLFSGGQVKWLGLIGEVNATNSRKHTSACEQLATEGLNSQQSFLVQKQSCLYIYEYIIC